MCIDLRPASCFALNKFPLTIVVGIQLRLLGTSCRPLALARLGRLGLCSGGLGRLAATVTLELSALSNIFALALALVTRFATFSLTQQQRQRR